MISSFRWLVLAVISGAMLLVVIDMTVLYTALPRLTHDLMASANQKLWIVNSYPLTMAGLLISMGALCDRYGAHLFFNAGLIIFGLASVIAAFAPSPELLIIARVLLGIGASAMMPATLSIVRKTFNDPAERSFAIGVWAAVASGGAALGPVVGGILLEYFWWGSVFLINVPVVLITLLFSVKLIPPVTANPTRVFDFIAAGQILLGMTGLVYAMKEFSKPDPQLSHFLVAGAVGAVMTAKFIHSQKISPAPMLNIAIFKSRLFSAGVITALIASASLTGIELAITQRLQLILDMSPLRAGLYILPLPLASFFIGPVIGYIIPYTGSIRAILCTLLISAAGAAVYLFYYDAGLWLSIISLSIVGAGLGGAMTAASTAIMLNSPESSAGTAASVEGVSYELGGAIGIALLGGFMSAVYMHFMSGVPSIPASAKDSIDGALLLAQEMASSQGEKLRNLAEEAFLKAFFVVFSIAIFILLATCLILGGWTRHIYRASEEEMS
ncbi:MFS transporter [Pantoea sp. FN0302]|uniref:MFS transporter n=1 Tax=unclassified Pantoea TaxID=2630326 RepID=UPI003CF0B9E3